MSDVESRSVPPELLEAIQSPIKVIESFDPNGNIDWDQFQIAVDSLESKGIFLTSEQVHAITSKLRDTKHENVPHLIQEIERRLQKEA